MLSIADDSQGMMLVAEFFRLLQEDNVEDDSMISTLTETQDKALSILPIFSGLLSMWGSYNIIAMYCSSDPTKRNNVYQRIMLGLSASDMLASFVLTLHPFMIPAATSQRAYASGTDATCSAMGFFQQLAFAEVWYNGMLSFFFLWKIKYSMSHEQMARREPWMHSLAIGFNLITATIGAALGMYGELVVGHFCWFTGTMGTYFAYFCAAAPFAFFMVAICVNNLLIYNHVRKSLQQQQQQQQTTTSSAVIVPLSNASSSNNHHHHDPAAATRTSTAESVAGESSATSADSGNSVFSNEEVREQQREAARLAYQKQRQQERLRAIAIQASLYVGSFLLTHLPTFIIRITSAIVGLSPSNEGQFFPLLLIQAILLPLQGLFNYLIYSRPLPYWREAL
ncbi:expressed unknown protein [Seminavis robusta]|uniref:G-protein coupled receptors family 1 profile domain-containing protein n=1 Tax=Seminavis robusta TaxID=568900 RepID=A0A9N8EHD2_9STRA|nr:expressed unknown protein [Seminavis robusta]|eukprot:Sro996_g229320.1 n/a (396) ;mRNA; f:29931-31118